MPKSVKHPNRPKSPATNAAKSTTTTWKAAVVPLAVACVAIALTHVHTSGPSTSAPPLSSSEAAAAWLATSYSPIRPLETIAALQPLLDDPASAGEAGSLPPIVVCRLLEAAADALSLCHRYPDVLAAHRSALTVAEEAGLSADTAFFTAAIADDLLKLERHEDALEQLETAHGLLSGLSESPQLTSVVLRMESGVYDCSGDPISALLKYEDSLAASPPGQMTVESVARHVDLLLKVLRGTPPPPPEVASHIQSKIQSLVEAGPWASPAQVPSHYVPFEAPPVFDVLDPASLPPGVADAVQYLKTAAQLFDLDAEVTALTKQHKLQVDAECLHVPSRGRWYRFPLNAPWQDRDERGCSVDTPVACAVVQGLRDLGAVSVLRAGYSIIDPNTHIQPHFGTTNTQLKLHLGVHVPAGPEGQACTGIRVVNETLVWTQGGVIVFDDSYEHEVRSACSDRRVVLQVVIAHPLAPQQDTDREAQLWASH